MRKRLKRTVIMKLKTIRSNNKNTACAGLNSPAFRPLALLLALAFLLPIWLRSPALAESDGKPRPKNRPGITAPAYHIEAEDGVRELPRQRSDLECGVIECMESARSAVLIEASSGQKLLSVNPDERLPMASTTKTMTALVVLEHCSPDEIVTAPIEAVGVDGSSLYLAYGERLTVRDLLYGLMLRSGNDCAVALAVHVGGSVEGFANLMNERAARLGLVNTHFVTPNGLHDSEHYTTAYELALIAAEAMKNELFREIVSSQYHTIVSSTRKITVKNKNSMLWDYEGCVGIKTGYTRQAGRCLLFAAERDGMLLIGCVLNCAPMFDVAPEMLDYGFENYTVVKLLEKGAELGSCEAEGSGDSIPLIAANDVYAPVLKGRELNAEVRLQFKDGVSAPVAAGQKLGEAILTVRGAEVGRAAVLAGTSVMPRNYSFYFDYLMSLFSNGKI